MQFGLSLCACVPHLAGLNSLSASVEVDQAQVNRLLLDLVAIGERHGIRFPRESAKQQGCTLR